MKGSPPDLNAATRQQRQWRLVFLFVGGRGCGSARGGGYDVAGGPPERGDFGEQTAGGLGEEGGLASWALFVGKVLGAVVRDATAKDAATGMYILQQVFQIGSL